MGNWISLAWASGSEINSPGLGSGEIRVQLNPSRTLMDTTQKFSELTAKEAQEVITRGVFMGSLAVALLYIGISSAFAGFMAS